MGTFIVAYESWLLTKWRIWTLTKVLCLRNFVDLQYLSCKVTLSSVKAKLALIKNRYSPVLRRLRVMTRLDIHRQIDRQRDRQTDRQTDRRMNIQAVLYFSYLQGHM